MLYVSSQLTTNHRLPNHQIDSSDIGFHFPLIIEWMSANLDYHLQPHQCQQCQCQQPPQGQ